MKTILGIGQPGIAVMQLLLEKNAGEKILMVNRNGQLSMQSCYLSVRYYKANGGVV
jgi:malic enzyme